MIMKQEVLKKVIRVYGEKNQVLKSIEELSELIQALSKYMALSNELPDELKVEECLNNILDEMADVEIMIEQLKMIFQFGILPLTTKKAQKIERLHERLEKYE